MLNFDLRKGLIIKINDELEDPNKLKKRQIVTHFTIIIKSILPERFLVALTSAN